MTTKKTGNTRKVYVERGYWIKEYEIRVEWYQESSTSTNLDLYCSSSSGAWPNGTCIAHNVEPYYTHGYWDPLYGLRIHSDYEFYDWVVGGTWYYMAEHSCDEVHETVP